MLESVTIVNHGGVVLYQYTASPSLMDKEQNGGGSAFTQACLQKHWYPCLLDPASPPDKTYLIQEGHSYLWKMVQEEFIVVAMYPDILFEGPRLYLKQWAERLVQDVSREFARYYLVQLQAREQQQQEQSSSSFWKPDPQPFDKVFRVLLESSKTQKSDSTTTETASSNNTSNSNSNTTSSSNKKTAKPGKEKRNWHDGKAKVTKEAMEGLDFSKDKDKNVSEQDLQQANERALQEARAAYLPTEADLVEEQNDKDSKDDDAATTSTLSNFFAHLTGTKKLTDADLDQPLQHMHELLTSKNVAADIAQELCHGVRVRLRNQTLSHGYRVATAVQQALQGVVEQLLQRHQVDVLQQIVHKRQKGDYSLFSSSSKGKAPYVICVIGINGVGKSTSLAKMTYYLKNHGCNPLLVAGDTFRSGAVEQLGVHAQCLDVPMFAQGYAKDPSAVAKAAIQEATQNGNDVVLIDTAGRMQNNAPLMKALGKLVQENQPDFVMLVAEALVGHDGLDQFHMFSRALGVNRKLDGLLLTKFDTVSDKVGAALTLTHETGAPIVFCGTCGLDSMGPSVNFTGQTFFLTS